MKSWLAWLILVANIFTGPAAAAPSREAICDWVAAAQASGDAIFNVPDQPGATTVRLRPPGPDWRLAMIDIQDASDRQLMLVRALPPCKILEARRLAHAADGAVDTIEILAPDLGSVIAREPQNPPLPMLGAGPGSAAMAHVDTGVN